MNTKGMTIEDALNGIAGMLFQAGVDRFIQQIQFAIAMVGSPHLDWLSSIPLPF